jgi:hypothetical protein
MTIEMFLQTVFQVSISVAFTALCGAGVAVSVFYSWKMAEGLIKRRERIIGKVKKSRFFSKETPAIRMVKAEKKARG